MNDDSKPSSDAPADDARDPYLRAALRHAPDAGERPPEALSARILAEARSSTVNVAGARAGAARPWVRRVGVALAAWWLATSRPSVAGAFATVVVATLVGVLWWDRPLDEATVRTPPAETSSPPVATTTPSTEAKPTGPAARSDATPDANAPSPGASLQRAPTPEAFPEPVERERAQRSTGPAPSRKVEAPQEARQSAADVAPKTDEGRDARGSPSAGAARTAVTPSLSEAGEPTKELRKSESAMAARRESEDAAAARRESESAAAARREGDSNRAAATSMEPPAPRAAAPASPTARNSALGDRLQASPQDAARTLERAPRDRVATAPAQASMATSLSALRARVRSEPDAWTWSRDGAADRRPVAALSAWLADAERAARGDAASGATAAKDASRNADSAAAGTEVELFDGERREAIVRITATALELIDGAGRVQRIALDPATAAALTASLPR